MSKLSVTFEADPEVLEEFVRAGVENATDLEGDVGASTTALDKLADEIVADPTLVEAAILQVVSEREHQSMRQVTTVPNL